MQKNSTVTVRPFAMAWGILSTLILPRSSMWKSVKKPKHGNVSSEKFKICDPIYENRTYEAILNFEKGTKKISCRIWLVARQSRLNFLLLSYTSRYVNKTYWLNSTMVLQRIW